MYGNAEEFIAHYGKRGMKWGFRKDQREKNRRQKVSIKRQHLSDGDLVGYINRLQAEKKLKTLIDEDISPGKAAAKSIMSESGKKVVTTIVAGAAVYGVKTLLKKKFNINMGF